MINHLKSLTDTGFHKYKLIELKKKIRFDLLYFGIEMIENQVEQAKNE